MPNSQTPTLPADDGYRLERELMLGWDEKMKLAQRRCCVIVDLDIGKRTPISQAAVQEELNELNVLHKLQLAKATQEAEERGARNACRIFIKTIKETKAKFPGSNEFELIADLREIEKTLKALEKV